MVTRKSLRSASNSAASIIAGEVSPFCGAFLFSSFRDSYLTSIHRSIKSSQTRGKRVIIYQLDPAILAFDQRGTAFHPITAVVIRNAAELPDRRAMDVAAEDRTY